MFMLALSLLLLLCLFKEVEKGQTKQTDYQINVYNDSTVIMDGRRVVGIIKYDSTSQFDKIINTDNQ